jgi:hypothetical protein
MKSLILAGAIAMSSLPAIACEDALVEAIAFQVTMEDTLDECYNGDNSRCLIFINLVNALDYRNNLEKIVECSKSGYKFQRTKLLEIFLRDVQVFGEKVSVVNARLSSLGME